MRSKVQNSTANCRIIIPCPQPSAYSVKCVAVESERVIVCDPLITPYYISKQKNQIKRYVDGPNFLELNRKAITRRKTDDTLLKNKNTNADASNAKTLRSKSLDFTPGFKLQGHSQRDRQGRLKVIIIKLLLI